MPKCPFCDHKNPAGIALCENCGAWMTPAEATTSQPAHSPRSEATSGAGGPEIGLEDRIRSLLAGGRKIEAIKVFREATGAGLKEAKDAVEAIGDARPFPPPEEVGDGFEQELISRLGRGEKIPAIKLYRERTGADLKAAKEAVEALALRHGIPARQAGCAGLVILALGFCGALVSLGGWV